MEISLSIFSNTSRWNLSCLHNPMKLCLQIGEAQGLATIVQSIQDKPAAKNFKLISWRMVKASQLGRSSAVSAQ